MNKRATFLSTFLVFVNGKFGGIPLPVASSGRYDDIAVLPSVVLRPHCLLLV